MVLIERPTRPIFLRAPLPPACTIPPVTNLKLLIYALLLIVSVLLLWILHVCFQALVVPASSDAPDLSLVEFAGPVALGSPLQCETQINHRRVEPVALLDAENTVLAALP